MGYASGVSEGVPTGTVLMYHGSTAPDGYFLCDGSQFDETENPKLFALLGSNRLPSLVNRFIKGTGLLPVGTVGGSETHNHGGTVGATGTVASGLLGLLVNSAPPNHTHSISRVNHQPPFYVLSYIIKGG